MHSHILLIGSLVYARPVWGVRRAVGGVGFLGWRTQALLVLRGRRSKWTFWGSIDGSTERVATEGRAIPRIAYVPFQHPCG